MYVCAWERLAPSRDTYPVGAEGIASCDAWTGTRSSCSAENRGEKSSRHVRRMHTRAMCALTCLPTYIHTYLPTQDLRRRNKHDSRPDPGACRHTFWTREPRPRLKRHAGSRRNLHTGERKGKGSQIIHYPLGPDAALDQPSDDR